MTSMVFILCTYNGGRRRAILITANLYLLTNECKTNARGDKIKLNKHTYDDRVYIIVYTQTPEYISPMTRANVVCALLLFVKYICTRAFTI